MNRYFRQIFSLIMLFIPTLAFASGGDDMLTLMVWFYTLVAIMHGALVLLFHNLQLYKYLWLVIVSVLFTTAALVVWCVAFSIVLEHMPQDKMFLVASFTGLIIYLAIVIWAVMAPIKQYRKLAIKI